MSERSIIALVSAPSGFAGRTDALPVSSRWWADVEPVNEVLEQLLGVRTSVLRLVSVEGGRRPGGGLVTYHVEAHGEPDRTHLHPAEEPAADAPHRLPWARLGGPSELVAWADGHVDRTGPAVQVKSWNLSSVHRLPTANGSAWLKTVPPFFADEGAVIAVVAEHDPGLVPQVIAEGPRRILLAEAPGTACWDTEPDHIREIVPRWVAVQNALAGEPRVKPCVVPMPDFGLPDTLVHGDFHPGNWFDSGTVNDWSDVVWGHPALDVGRLVEFCRPELGDLIRQVWSEAWLRHRPDSRPIEALDTARRASHLLGAVQYQEFLDNIEDSEHVYHRDDPARELRAARRQVR
ncbi:phosphotransferase family protein [Lentzea sp. NPDC058436]|uniref:phosphotransferase family protein n=1 Tax=Lentzea sp. NPDC058436 TaxID=3346499 RepID=UPI003646B411